MISLRKHIDDYRNEPVETGSHRLDIPETLVSEFRAILLAIGHSADHAGPNLGTDLSAKMSCLDQR